MDYALARFLGALALAVALAGFLIAWPVVGLKEAGIVASIIAGLAILAGPLLRHTIFNLPPSTPRQLNIAYDALREEVESVWVREARHRGLTQPPPARVIWGSQHPSPVATLSTMVRHVLRSPSIDTAKQYQDWLASEYRRIPHTRLIIRADAGGGKSALALLLTLGLLNTLKNYDSMHSSRIPILASVASWDPGRDSMNQWLARWIKTTYRSLNSPEYGGTAVDGLIASHKILPILDGLDELPKATWARVLERIAKIPEGEPLIITCRTNPFEEFTKHAGNPVGFYLLELATVQSAQAGNWLQEMCVERPDQLDAWQPVIQALLKNRDPVLAEALELPLYLQLSRVVFGSALGDKSPSFLLNRDNLQAVDDIRTYLLSNFTREAFRKDPSERPLKHPSGNPAKRPLGWDPPKAEQWLAFAARRLQLYETQNLTWWRMHRAVPPSVFGLTVGIATGICYALTRDLPEGLTKGFTVGVSVAILIGLSRGLQPVRNSGLRTALISFISSFILVTLTGYYILGNFFQASADGIEVAFAVSAVVASAKTFRRSWQTATGLCVLIGIIDGIFVGTWSTMFQDVDAAFRTAKDIAFSISFGIGIAMLFATFLLNKATPAHPQRRDFSLHQKRPPSIQLLRGLAAGSAIGLAGGIVGTFHHNLRYGIALGLTFGIVAGIPVGLIGGLIRWFNEPTTSLPAATPRSTLNDDRIVAVVCIFSIILVSMLSINIVGLHFFDIMKSSVRPVTLNWEDGLRFGICIGIGLACGITAWPSFLLAHVWLSVTGRMPWRLIRFLGDSYTLGVLRQEGAVYQFRHASVGAQLSKMYQGRP